MGRGQILLFRSRRRISVWVSLPEMRERGCRGLCHRRHIVLSNSLESPVPGLPRDWGWFVMGILSSGGSTENGSSGHWLLRAERGPPASFGWNPGGIFLFDFLATCMVERIVGNWYSSRWPARGSLYSSCICCRHFRYLCSAEKERWKADLERGQGISLGCILEGSTLGGISGCAGHTWDTSGTWTCLWICCEFVFCDCCFILGVDDGLYLSAAIFQMMTWPDPILEWKKNQEGSRLNVWWKIHVKVSWSCFTHGCQWIGYPGFEVHVNVVGIVLLTVLNMLMSVEWISLTLLTCLWVEWS